MAGTTRKSAKEPTPAEGRRAILGELQAIVRDVHGRVESSASRQAEEAQATARLLKTRTVKRAEEADPALAGENRTLAAAARARQLQARELERVSRAVDKQISKDLDDLAGDLFG
jgi:hypothetical protein